MSKRLIAELSSDGEWKTKFRNIYFSISCSVGPLRNQLKLLWSSKMIRSMFDELYDQPILDKGRSSSVIHNGKESKKIIGPIFKLPRLSTSGNFWKLLHISYKNSSSTDRNAISQIPLSIQSVCMLYFFTTNSLSQIRDDILAGDNNLHSHVT